MHWAVSDVHGCYEQYRKLLEKSISPPPTPCTFWGMRWTGARSL